LVAGARRLALDGATHLTTLGDEIVDAALEHAKADRFREVEV
jgi:hypothetical protein